MKKTSIKLLKIFIFFTLLSSILISFYIVLYNGIIIDRFNINGIKISGFYLSLDKKLILKINDIDFTQSKKDSDFDLKSNLHHIKNIHLALQYFQQIEINTISFENYKAKLAYDGENFSLDSNLLYTKAKLQEQNSKIKIFVEDFFIKPYAIYYQANGEYDINSRILNTNGTLKFWDKDNNKEFITINLDINSDLENIILKGNSSEFKDIKFLRNILPTAKDKLVDSWIYDNYQVKDAIIQDLYINIPLKSKNIIQESIDSLYIIGEARNAEVKFHESLQTINAQSVKLIFQNHNLEFYPKNATYKNHALEDSSVILEDLSQPDRPTLLKININANTKLDSEIISLLQAYEINLPIIAKHSNIKSNLHLDINLKNHKVLTNGIFKTTDNEILINNIPIQTKTAEIQLDNNIVTAHIKEAKYKDMLNASANFTIELDNKIISGELEVIESTLSQENKDILLIQNSNIPFNIDFNDSLILNLPTLQITGIFGDLESKITLNSLENLKHFSKILNDYKVTSGNAQIITKDFIEYHAVFDLQTQQEILLDKQNKAPIQTTQLSLSYTPTKYTIRSSDSKLRIVGTKESQEINLHNAILNANKSTLANDSNNQTNIIIKGTNADIIVNDDFYLLSDNFNISINNGLIVANLQHKNGVLNLKKKDEYVMIKASEFGDDFLNTLGNKKIFHNGRFYLEANTDDNGVIIGEFSLASTSINNLATLHNIFTFIDSVPSLLSLKMPGFNDKGYYVESGKVKFGIDKEYVAIESLNFNGSSMDIKGKGIVALNDKSIDFHAQLITAKNLSGIINKIPGVNYILLGEDGNISTSFRIGGTIGDPKVHTQATQDALIAPFNILKRTITSPFDIFKK